MAALGYIEAEEICLRAILVCYGTYADVDCGLAIKEEINTMWNLPLVVWEHEGNLYKVRVAVEVEVETVENVKRMLAYNTSHLYNFVRIEEKNRVERSMMGRGLGQNSGHWLRSDDLGRSTTAAHEFGHALGLPHPRRLDYRGTGYPPIMAPRGTLVDAEFQWNPGARAGEFGGTMKPIHRRVQAEEVREVMARAHWNGSNYIIGEISNTFYSEWGDEAYV